MRFVLKALLIGSLAAPAIAVAQEAAAPATDAAAKSDFAKAERLRELRHKHLWMGYAAAWLVIFGFIWRTHGLSKGTEKELQALKRRIEGMEGKQDG